MPTPGPLLASGRDADIYEYGPRQVLRRARSGRSLEHEARTMEFVRRHGFPVPVVEELRDGGTAMVMERVDGPSMVQVLGARPWRLGREAARLARLHEQLHDIEAPRWLPPAPGTPGGAVLHLDLHPLNVLLSPRGPVVIDWPAAARGDGSADVALTWVLLVAGAIPANRVTAALAGRLRSRFVRRFLDPFDLDAVRRQLDAVVGYKVVDPHMSEAERAAMRRLAATAGGG